MGRRSKGKSSSAPVPSSSMIEKLKLLRSFVGTTTSEKTNYSETDLSTCLRQSGYNVELAAERLLTGQFQPATNRPKTTKYGNDDNDVIEILDDGPTVSTTATLNNKDRKRPAAAAAGASAAGVHRPATTARPSPVVVSSSLQSSPHFVNNHRKRKAVIDPTSTIKRAPTTPITTSTLSSSSNKSPQAVSPSQQDQELSRRKRTKNNIETNKYRHHHHHRNSSNNVRTMTPKKKTMIHSSSTIYKNKHDNSNKIDNDIESCWLLCHRWLSDGICTSRNGCVDYQEELFVDDYNISDIIRFRGTRIRGQFPLELGRQILAPLLAYRHQKSDHTMNQQKQPLIRLKAHALMEERYLPIGAPVAFSLRVYLPDPVAFFTLFDPLAAIVTGSSTSTNSSREFFQQKKNKDDMNNNGAKKQSSLAKSSKKRLSKQGNNIDEMIICNAAFALLQWAQHGDSYDFIIPEKKENGTNINNTSSSQTDDDDDDSEELIEDVEANAVNIDESSMPEWATLPTTATTATSKNNKTNKKDEKDDNVIHVKELYAPSDFKVSLRPYQRQALWWLRHREDQSTFDECSRQQLELLKELANSKQGGSNNNNNNNSSSIIHKGHPSAIHCDCSPVVVDTTKIDAPAIRNNDGTANGTKSTNSDLNHPLWERRYITSYDKSRALSFYVQPWYGIAMSYPPLPPQPCRGGILADSMGLGKTVMLLALLQQSKIEEIEKAKDDDRKMNIDHQQEEEERGKEDKSLSSSATTTLIVTPLSLLSQWEEEIASKTSLSYLVHYGETKKKSNTTDFHTVDVVLTTYGSLQGELQTYKRFKNEENSNKKQKKTTKKKKKLEDGNDDYDYDEEEEDNFTSLNSSSALDGLDGILGFTWKRVILDEAHCIKNVATVASRACCLLNAERRWCVSGTIIQNSLDDVYALMKFLRHEPWCQRSFWKAAITDVSDMSEALGRVKRLLTPIMLRRTKETLDENGKPILTLPDIDTKIIPVQFTIAERQFYDALHRKSLNLFEGYIQSGTASKSWLAIFSLLQRLRQTCDHVALTIKSHINHDEWSSNISSSQQEQNVSCCQNVDKDDNETQQLDRKGSKNAIDPKFLNDLMKKFQSVQKSSTKKTKKKIKGRYDDSKKKSSSSSSSSSSRTDNDDTIDIGASSASPSSSSSLYATKIATMLNEAVQSQSSMLKEECAICLEPINIHDSVVTPCFHIFCKDCLVDVLRERYSNDVKKNSSNSQNDDGDNNQEKEKESASQQVILRCPSGPCPVCTDHIDSSKILRLSKSAGTGRIQTTYLLNSLVSPEYTMRNEENDTARHVLESAVSGGFSSSSKLSAILHELENVWEEEPNSKVLIFSQFLGFLDLIGQSFNMNGIPYARLDGSLTLKERMTVLREFGSSEVSKVDGRLKDDSEDNEDNDDDNASLPTKTMKRKNIGSVLLVSMKAGGVGLNLVAARTVFITDPWWNVAVEDQCVDRIHRIGQVAKKVRVRKFFITDSVEERIIAIQKRKKGVATEVLCDMNIKKKNENDDDVNDDDDDDDDGTGNRPTLEDFKVLFRGEN